MLFDEVLFILKMSCCLYGVFLCVVSRNEQRIGNKVDLNSCVPCNPCRCLRALLCIRGIFAYAQKTTFIFWSIHVLKKWLSVSEILSSAAS